MAEPLRQDNLDEPDCDAMLVGLDAFKAALAEARSKGPVVVALDLETDGLQIHEARVVWLSWCIGYAPDVYGAVPVRHRNPRALNENLQDVAALVREIHQSDDVTAVWHNAAFDLSILVAESWLDLAAIRADRLFDTMIASLELNPVATREGARHGLKELHATRIRVKAWGQKRMPNFEGVSKGRLIHDVPLNEAAWYASFDAWSTRILYDQLRHAIDADSKMANHFYRIEMPHVLTTVELKTSGLRLRPQESLPVVGSDGDKEIRLEPISKLVAEYERAVKTVFDLCGRTFSFSSPDALRRALFIDTGMLRSTSVRRTGRLSIDAGTLVRVFVDEHAQADVNRQKLIAYTLYAKQLAETIEKHREMYGEVNVVSGRIHSQIEATTANGRFRSSSPNLLSLSSSSRIKHHIVPDDGNVFVIADFSQIDLRVIANEAAEVNATSTMAKAINDGVDLHMNTLKIVDDRAAAKTEWNKLKELDGEIVAFNLGGTVVPIADEEKELARKLMKLRGDVAKKVNFGVSYGLGVDGLLDNLTVTDDMRHGIVSLPADGQSDEEWLSGLQAMLHKEKYTLADAERFLARFHRTYPDIGKFQKAVAADLIKSGFTYNLFGRRCRAETIPHLFRSPDLDLRLSEREWARIKVKTAAVRSDGIECLVEAAWRLKVTEPAGNRKTEIGDLRIELAEQIYNLDLERLEAALASWQSSREKWLLVDELDAIHRDGSWEAEHLFAALKPVAVRDSVSGTAAGIADVAPAFPFVLIPHRLIKRHKVVSTITDLTTRAVTENDSREIAYINFDKLRRNLISMRVASTSMDFCKIAMATFRARAAQRWPDKSVRPKVVNCIHDEIAVECREADQDEVKTMLRGSMEDDINYERFVTPGRIKRVAIRADIKVGDSYAKAKP
jgi:DNA polymerase I-like protein with 3'-5' exonuclease and polymerase domains